MQILEKLDFNSVLASTVHDMKNSLNLLVHNVEQIIEVCCQGTCQSQLQLAHLGYEAKRINHHLIQLLALYKQDHGQLSIAITEVNLAEFLEEIKLYHQQILGAKGIEIEIHCDENIHWFLDSSLMTGVLHNIINNAYRYSHSKIILSAQITDEMLQLQIEDDGEGYPESMTVNANPPPGMVDFRNGNTGLGLYFAGLVAALHKNKHKQGQIQVNNSSSLGGGCFKLILP